MRHLIRFILGICIALLFLQPFSQAAHQKVESIRAGVTCKLLQFITWPPTEKDHLNLGIFGSEDFAKAFLPAQKKRVNNQSLMIQSLGNSPTLDQLDACDVIYFPSAEGMSKDVQETLSKKGILLIGQGKDFIRKGGHLQLFMKNGKVSFSINNTECKKLGITFRSQVLRLAQEVL